MTQWSDLQLEADEFPRRPRRPAGPSLGRRLVGFVAAFAALGLVGGAAWLGFRHTARSGDEGGVPLIKADLRPIRIKPEQPGGMEVPHQGRMVFDLLDRDSAQPLVERLLPPPEVPLPRPVAPPPPPAAAPAPSAVPAPVPAVDTAPGTLAGVGTGVNADDAAALSALAARTAAAGAPAPGNPAPSAAAAPPRPVAAVRPPPPAAVLAAPPPLVTPPATAGRYRIQLGSVRSEAEAQGEWKRLQAKFGASLAGLSLHVARIDLGERGIFYRVQAGFLDEAHAKAICGQILAGQSAGGCQLVRQ